MKKYLFLGAAWGQISPLSYFKNQDNVEIYIADNQPNNPGHKISDKSFNVSTDDVSSLRKIVNEFEIDSVYCFASDVGQISQSVLSQEIGQHSNPIESIKTLTNKLFFREFLFNEGIQKNFFMELSSEDLADQKTLKKIIDNIPLVVKPIHGSGSKGVNFIFCSNDLKLINDSLKFSPSSTVIIENFLHKEGMQICGDGYFEDSILKNFTTGDGHFYDDSSNKVPYAESFPSTHSNEIISKAKLIIEKILKKAGYEKGPINFDIIVVDNMPFIVEIAPRTGGNYIPDVIKKHNGVDLLRATLNTYSDKHYKFDEQEGNIKYVSSYMIHSLKEGNFVSLQIKEDLLPYIYDKILYVQKGDMVKEFTQGSHAIGNIKFQFPDFETQREKMYSINEGINVHVN